MAGSVAFLFMDECIYEPLDLAALTGVLVPSDRYAAVRDAICQIVWDVQRRLGIADPAPIELHARDLLPQIKDKSQEVLDAERLSVLESAVNIVNSNRLSVYRVAYLNHKEISDTFKFDPKLYALNFFGMGLLLQEKLADTLIFPVMDGVPGCPMSQRQAPAIDPQLIRAFALHVRHMQHVRRNDNIANNLPINYANLAEPAFVDSEYSTLVQLTDLVSYLLLQRDREELARPSEQSCYREKVIEIAQGFESDLLHCWKGTLRID